MSMRTAGGWREREAEAAHSLKGQSLHKVVAVLLAGPKMWNEKVWRVEGRGGLGVLVVRGGIGLRCGGGTRGGGLRCGGVKGGGLRCGGGKGGGRAKVWWGKGGIRLRCGGDEGESRA